MCFQATRPCKPYISDYEVIVMEYDFSDICPYDDAIFHDKMTSLVEEPGFLHALSFCVPPDGVEAMKQELLSIDNKHDFQTLVMFPFLQMVAKNTTAGITIGGSRNYNSALNYTFISNHRDIVLDASFLNLAFLRQRMPTTEVAIGNNLLIYDWITDLVRLNKSFIVKRDTGMRQALEAAKKLSAYIHHTILHKHESVWIAQREGRAKDSSDHTQESLVKMLALGGQGTFMEKLKEINLMPVAISYEYDPNDYLKAREFLLKRRDPNYKKSQRDDLFSMETGLLQYKGKVHFQLTPRINSRIDEIGEFRDNNKAAGYVCRIIDNAIHRSYEIFPINYIAYDWLNATNRFRAKYTEEEETKFKEYIDGQIAKIDLPDMQTEEVEYLRTLLLTMYANPLINKLKALLGGVE